LANKSDLEYNAPELIRGEVGDSKVDIWSLGALAYYIIDGMSPFYGETQDSIKENILKSEVQFTSDAWE
jgi:serine/threonine protein kinase